MRRNLTALRFVFTLASLLFIAILKEPEYFFNSGLFLRLLAGAIFLSVMLAAVWRFTYLLSCIVFGHPNENNDVFNFKAFIATDAVSLYFYLAAAFIFYYYAAEATHSGVWITGPKGVVLVENGSFTLSGLHNAVSGISYLVFSALALHCISTCFAFRMSSRNSSLSLEQKDA